jgi:hypothetical protein
MIRTLEIHMSGILMSGVSMRVFATSVSREIRTSGTPTCEIRTSVSGTLTNAVAIVTVIVQMLTVEIIHRQQVMAHLCMTPTEVTTRRLVAITHHMVAHRRQIHMGIIRLQLPRLRTIIRTHPLAAAIHLQGQAIRRRMGMTTVMVVTRRLVDIRRRQATAMSITLRTGIWEARPNHLTATVHITRRRSQIGITGIVATDHAATVVTTVADEVGAEEAEIVADAVVAAAAKESARMTTLLRAMTMPIQCWMRKLRNLRPKMCYRVAWRPRRSKRVADGFR